VEKTDSTLCGWLLQRSGPLIQEDGGLSFSNFGKGLLYSSIQLLHESGAQWSGLQEPDPRRACGRDDAKPITKSPMRRFECEYREPSLSGKNGARFYGNGLRFHGPRPAGAGG